jgi:hypothetical protein
MTVSDWSLQFALQLRHECDYTVTTPSKLCCSALTRIKFDKIRQVQSVLQCTQLPHAIFELLLSEWSEEILLSLSLRSFSASGILFGPEANNTQLSPKRQVLE